MANRLPHIIVQVQHDVDVDFSLVPITTELIEGIATRLKDTGPAVPDGYPVFFQRPNADFPDDEYRVVLGRPDIHWRHFKGAAPTYQVLYRSARHWMVRWRGRRGSTDFDTAGVPVSVLAATRNPYLEPGTWPMARLPDGTRLYPAYHPVRPGDRARLAMGFWNGSSGEWTGVTLDGHLYRQRQYWGGDIPRPDGWQRFKLA